MSYKKKRSSADDDDNEFVVEKILDKRRNKDGGIEYLIKWENYPMEDSTWESEANASCPDLIAEFERERRKKKAEKSGGGSHEVAPVGEDNGEVDEILGMTEQRAGERCFVVRFADGTVTLMSVPEMHTRHPTEALKFYEKRIRFADVTKE